MIGLPKAQQIMVEELKIKSCWYLQPIVFLDSLQCVVFFLFSFQVQPSWLNIVALQATPSEPLLCAISVYWGLLHAMIFFINWYWITLNDVHSLWSKCTYIDLVVKVTLWVEELTATAATTAGSLLKCPRKYRIYKLLHVYLSRRKSSVLLVTISVTNVRHDTCSWS